MPLDALGIHNVVIQVGVIGIDPRCGDFRDKIFTPRHVYVPSLYSICCTYPVGGQVAFPCSMFNYRGAPRYYTAFHQFSPVVESDLLAYTPFSLALKFVTVLLLNCEVIPFTP
jgi:hypothetical protein